MADGTIVPTTIPEIFTRVRGEITDVSGEVYLLRASGEELVAQKGTQLYLNDVLLSYDNSTVLINLGDNGLLSLGQEQALTLTQDLFERIHSMDQVASLEEAISIEVLEQAIAEGRSLEDILQAPAAGNGIENVDASASSLVFYQRSGDALIPVSGFETTTLGREFLQPINEFGADTGDLDRNNPLNANQAPVALADAVSIGEDSAGVNINVLANDSDPDGDSIRVVAASVDTGEVSVNADGSLNYIPPANYSGVATITYTIEDEGGASSSTTVTVNVLPENDPPIANDDSATTAEDTPITLGLADLVLPNDIDVDGDTLSISAVANAVNGTVVLNSDGTITFTPDANFSGEASFEYTVDDGNGGSDSALVSVDVTPVDDQPLAVADTFTATEDTPFVGDVSGNDTLSGDGGNSFSVAPGAGPTNGTVTMNTDGTFSYTPNANYSGSDSFTYTLTDADGDTSTATVSIAVDPADDDLVITAIEDGAVSEEGLSTSSGAASDGNPDTQGNPSDSTDAATFTGTYSATSTVLGGAVVATLSEPLSALTSGGEPIVWTGSGTNTLVGSAAGNEVIEVTITGPLAGTGSYQVTLSGPIDHPEGEGENLLDIEFGFSLNNGASLVSDSFTITVEDDSPTAFDVVDNLNATSQNIATNLILVLDVSGSMEQTLPIAVAALESLIQVADEAGNVNIQIVPFAAGATSSGWLVDDVQAAIDYLNGLSTDGGTQYNVALEEVIAVNNDTPPPAADQTLLYFVSDGLPADGSAVADGSYDGAAGVAGWEAYVSANIDTAYGIGIPGAEIGPLQAVAFPNDNGDENALVLADAADLAATLIASFNQGSVSGSLSSLLAANGGAGFSLGGDDGYVSQITIDGVDYQYDPETASAGDESIVVTTALGGQLTFNFLDGSYQYSINVNTSQLGDQELFQAIVTDYDGDSALMNFTIDIAFTPGVDANVDQVLTNILDGASIAIPEQALLWNDAETNGTISSVSGALNGNVVNNNGDIAFTPLYPPVSESDFETTDPAEIISEDPADSETNPSNNTLASAIDFTDRTLFSTNDDNIAVNIGNAASLQFNGNISSDGDSGNGQDQDWMMFQLAEGEEIWFDIDPPSISSLDIFIYDANGNQLAQIVENGGGPFGSYTADYEGIYYAQIQGDNPTDSGDYYLDISIDPTNAVYASGYAGGSLTYTLSDNGVTDTAAVNIVDINSATISGSDSDEVLLGSDSSDTLNAAGGDDALVAGAGNDILDGGAGSDILFGGQGSDSLTGGGDADTFVWQAGDGDGATDTITDFTVGPGGDTLDFADLLQGEDSGNLSDYLSIASDGVDTTITVDADGVGGDTDLTVVLEGVDLTALGADQAAILQQMIDDGNLTIHQ